MEWNISVIKPRVSKETYRRDEDAMIIGCIEGDRRARSVLYETYHPMMMGVSYRYFLDRNSAEDAVHDAFEIIFKKLDSFRGQSKLSSWMTRIVINRCLEELRSKYHKDVVITDEPEVSHHEEAITREELEHQSCEQVLDLMKQLPDGYRMVLTMYAIDGLTHKEIASYLDITENTSRSQLTKARQKLRTLLNEQNHGRK